MDSIRLNKDWPHASSKDFWGEIAPFEHVVQFYENDNVFLDLLFGFVSGGFTEGDAIIVIATSSHLQALQEKLKVAGFDADKLVAKNEYIPLDAESTLAKFMINDWPDETLFMEFVTSLITSAKSEGRRVRAFGEMVAILWAKGHVGATVRLEHLWNKFCENQSFCLFCAYPESGFIQDASESLLHICSAHAKVVAGVGPSKTEVFYKSVEKQAG
jgi:hypothetical protein